MKGIRDMRPVSIKEGGRYFENEYDKKEGFYKRRVRGCCQLIIGSLGSSRL